MTHEQREYWKARFIWRVERRPRGRTADYYVTHRMTCERFNETPLRQKEAMALCEELNVRSGKEFLAQNGMEA